MINVYGGYYHDDMCERTTPEIPDGIMIEVDGLIVAKHVDKRYYESMMDAVANQVAQDTGEAVKLKVTVSE